MRTRVMAMTPGALAVLIVLAGCQKPPTTPEAAANPANARTAAPAPTPAAPKTWLDYTVPECREPLRQNKVDFGHCLDEKDTKAVARLLDRDMALMSSSDRGVSCNAEDGCKQTVHVKEDDAGNCTAELRYGKLEVSGSKKGRQVVWNLSPPPGQSYDFASPGIGVSPTDPPATGYADATLWWRAANAPSNKQAVLNIELAAPAAGNPRPTFCHYPRVVNRRNPAKLCCPIDPIIINDP